MPGASRDVPVSSLCISRHASIREAVTCIDANRKGIALITEDDRRLIATVTDGDVRRALLAGVTLDALVTEILTRKGASQYARPVTAPVGTDENELLRLMLERFIRQIPLLDEGGRVAGLAMLDDLLPSASLPAHAVIMAGGFGKRLLPLTTDIPKPMLPVGGRPLMERALAQLKSAGIQRVEVTTHYLSSKIADYFGDGRDFGVELTYTEETEPLGTAGALGLMQPPPSAVLVMNGDVLTSLDVRAMVAFHREHRADLTVAVRRYEIAVPYGIVEGEGAFVRAVTEKPVLNLFVNAGVYLLEPVVYRYIPSGQHFDMTDLIQKLLDDKRTVVSFPVREYWLDIGARVDYEQAQEDVRHGNVS